MYNLIKRLIDLILVIITLPISFLLIAIFFLVFKLIEGGPFLYWSKRVGINNEIFLMPKIRTMKLNTPQLATHLMTNPDSHLISIGSFLRKSSLDELPQLYSVFIGDMTLVGPRPALFNQFDLIELRTNHGINNLKPGITGYAQINGRDENNIQDKVELDKYYLNNKSIFFDFQILIKTFFNVLLKKGINH